MSAVLWAYTTSVKVNPKPPLCLKPDRISIHTLSKIEFETPFKQILSIQDSLPPLCETLKRTPPSYLLSVESIGSIHLSRSCKSILPLAVSISNQNLSISPQLNS
ncbi:unnamed protein product [Lactuca virosa]|uniref:Uncharacterized protein n=1 Tax=Lactuca virosa TaxID=75947 RepID=A0AAU9N8W6_9ASTR|nr:unnamed protein product [Lactuca virosa]